MKFNQDYMDIMRRGKLNKNWMYYDIKKQDDAGLALGLCIVFAGLVVMVEILIK